MGEVVSLSDLAKAVLVKRPVVCVKGMTTFFIMGKSDSLSAVFSAVVLTVSDTGAVIADTVAVGFSDGLDMADATENEGLTETVLEAADVAGTNELDVAVDDL